MLHPNPRWPDGRLATLDVAVPVNPLGLRHRVDADHGAAIDDVARKLLQNGRRPGAAGFFAIGYSAAVTIVAAAVACLSTVFVSLKRLPGIAETISYAALSVFLLPIAAINIAILLLVSHSYRRLPHGGISDEADLELLLSGRGQTARLLSPLLRLQPAAIKYRELAA